MNRAINSAGNQTLASRWIKTLIDHLLQVTNCLNEKDEQWLNIYLSLAVTSVTFIHSVHLRLRDATKALQTAEHVLI